MLSTTKNKKTIFITGGAGFIGSALIRYILSEKDLHIINIDCLTYAGNVDSIKPALSSNRYVHEKINICDKNILDLFIKYQPSYVMHLAAESHVDRSIVGPSTFIDTNIFGTFNLLEASKDYFDSLNSDNRKFFRVNRIVEAIALVSGQLCVCWFIVAIPVRQRYQINSTIATDW